MVPQPNSPICRGLSCKATPASQVFRCGQAWHPCRPLPLFLWLKARTCFPSISDPTGGQATLPGHCKAPTKMTRVTATAADACLDHLFLQIKVKGK